MIKDLLDLCKQAGVDNIGFTTNRDAAAPKPAEAPDPPKK